MTPTGGRSRHGPPHAAASLSRRDLLLAGAAGGLALAGCGSDDPRLNRQRQALARRSVAIDYASYYAPIEDVRRLALARAAAVGAQLTLSDDAAGAAAQLANLKRWTGPRGGFRAVAVAPVDPAPLEPVTAAAVDRGIAIVSYVVALSHQTAAITVDQAAAGRRLAQDARRHGPGGRVLLVGPPPGAPFGSAFAPAAAAIRATVDVAATVAALGEADAERAVGAALRGSRVRTVLAWNDTTALGAAAALRPDDYAGGLGAPSLTSAASLTALRADGPLRCLVAARLADLAAALVDVPFALARGRETRGRTVPAQLLRPGVGAVDRYAADFAT